MPSIVQHHQNFLSVSHYLHEDNGLLIENFDGAKLSKAYNRFVLEEELYLHCKQNAEKSIEHLKIENIAAQWTNYLKNELP